MRSEMVRALTLPLRMCPRCAWSLLLLIPLCASASFAAAPTTAETQDPIGAELHDQSHAAVDRALAHLAATQRPDGSFLAPVEGQPAITALATLAFLSRGHLPEHGQYGQNI